MAKVVRDKLMAVSPEALYQTIVDFDAYPEFLPEVKSAKASGKGSKIVVDLEIEVIKRFDYRLEFQLKAPLEAKWSLVSSNFFKKNDGLWRLSPNGKGVDAHYELDVEFGFLVPGWVTKKMTEVSLPTMFERFEKRAADRNGR